MGAEGILLPATLRVGAGRPATVEILWRLDAGGGTRLPFFRAAGEPRAARPRAWGAASAVIWRCHGAGRILCDPTGPASDFDRLAEAIADAADAACQSPLASMALAAAKDACGRADFTLAFDAGPGLPPLPLAMLARAAMFRPNGESESGVAAVIKVQPIPEAILRGRLSRLEARELLRALPRAPELDPDALRL
jgi:hypothetical protein